jgi:gamma-glutamylcyclotransferase (GGCT)/AIG2-like uncharacterized protein YtfP
MRGVHCFTYGSLMCADIMASVCGQAFAAEDAVLDGHTRHPVQGEAYPGMVRSANGQVAGRLYLDLDALALHRLDAFEGEMYERRAVQVRLADGRLVAAQTYLFRAAFAHLLQPGEWDFERFLATGKAGFQARYVGFERLA